MARSTAVFGEPTQCGSSRGRRLNKAEVSHCCDSCLESSEKFTFVTRLRFFGEGDGSQAGYVVEVLFTILTLMVCPLAAVKMDFESARLSVDHFDREMV